MNIIPFEFLLARLEFESCRINEELEAIDWICEESIDVVDGDTSKNDVCEIDESITFFTIFSCLYCSNDSRFTFSFDLFVGHGRFMFKCFMRPINFSFVSIESEPIDKLFIDLLDKIEFTYLD